MIVETPLQEISCKRIERNKGQKSNCFSKAGKASIQKTTRTYRKIFLFSILFLILSSFHFINAINYEDWASTHSATHSPFENNLPSDYYCIENGLFTESMPVNSIGLRSLPEDIEDGENPLGIVPVGGKEASILSAFAIFYFLLLRRKIKRARTNKQ